MDYETSVILSRPTIRLIANFFRKMFKIRTIVFPVLKVLEKMVIKFCDNLYYVVEDDELFEPNVMAELIDEGDETHYCIRIRESIYNKAVIGDRAAIGFICHEMCHFFLIFVCGVGPKKYFTTDGLSYSRAVVGTFKPIYKSMEWQAMALCGEVMIPYEKCINYSYKQLISRTKSSNKQAMYFLQNVASK